MSSCVMGLPTGGYTGSASTSMVEVRTAGYAVPGCVGADGAVDLEGWERVEVGCGGASILIALETGGSFGLGVCVLAV